MSAVRKKGAICFTWDNDSNDQTNDPCTQCATRPDKIAKENVSGLRRIAYISGSSVFATALRTSGYGLLEHISASRI